MTPAAIVKQAPSCVFLRAKFDPFVSHDLTDPRHGPRHLCRD